jgi:CRP/FNR family cyclic AMP-dependent transcriptional regulator
MTGPLPGVPREHLGTLAEHATIRSYPKNAIVINEGDETDSLYVVLSGKVKVFVSDENGREIDLGIEGPGEYFGEMVLDGGPRSASVMTLEPCKFAIVHRSEFAGFLAKNPDFALDLINRLIHKIRDLTQNVKSLALMDVYGRVARLLLELAEEREGKLVISGKLTQQDLANRIGASREMVSRIFRDLAIGGYITISGKTITIHKKPPPRW